MSQRCRYIRRLRTLYPCTYGPAVPLYSVPGDDCDATTPYPARVRPEVPLYPETPYSVPLHVWTSGAVILCTEMTVTRRLRTLHVWTSGAVVSGDSVLCTLARVDQRCRYTLYGDDCDATTPYPARVDQRCRCIRRLRTLYPCTCEPAVPLYYVHGVDSCYVDSNLGLN